VMVFYSLIYYQVETEQQPAVDPYSTALLSSS
jgi:hypothetical protein